MKFAHQPNIIQVFDSKNAIIGIRSEWPKQAVKRTTKHTSLTVVGLKLYLEVLSVLIFIKLPLPNREVGHSQLVMSLQLLYIKFKTVKYTGDLSKLKLNRAKAILI